MLCVPAQVKVPKPPDTYDATVRYRIQADRNERVLQYEEMTKFFGKLGFKETESEDSDLGPFDPTAEIISGTVPSKTARDILGDRRVQTVLLAPAGYKSPDDPQARVRVLIELGHSRDQLALWNQTGIALARLGFKADLGFDARAFTIVRGYGAGRQRAEAPPRPAPAADRLVRPGAVAENCSPGCPTARRRRSW